MKHKPAVHSIPSIPETAPSGPESPCLEILKLEVSIRLAEFTALRAEIVATLTPAYQVTTLALTAIGIVVVASPFLLTFDRPLLFLGASVFFSCFTMVELRYEHAVYKMSNHIGNVVAPALRRALNSLVSEGPDRFRDMLTWEKGGRPATHSNEILFLPLEVSRVLITVGASACAIVGYLCAVLTHRTLVVWDWLCLSVASSILLYAGIMVLRVRRVLRTDSKNK